MFMKNFTKSIMVILVRKAKLILVTGQLLLLVRIIPILANVVITPDRRIFIANL